MPFYTMDRYEPNPMKGGPWTHSGYQTWYRAVNGENDSDLDGDAEARIPLISGAFLSMAIVPRTGDLSDLDMDLEAVLVDLVGAPGTVIDTVVLVGTGVIATDIYKSVVFSPLILGAHVGIAYTHLRPTFVAESTIASTFDICISQVPIGFHGRGNY